MGVHKIKKGPYYYADYYDFNGVRRRISLQTENKQIALLKYQELIRCRNAVKERMPVHITWDAFKDKLLYHMSVERSRNTVTHTKLAIRYLEEMKLPGLTPGVSFAPESQLRLISPATNYQRENKVFS